MGSSKLILSTKLSLHSENVAPDEGFLQLASHELLVLPVRAFFCLQSSVLSRCILIVKRKGEPSCVYSLWQEEQLPDGVLLWTASRNWHLWFSLSHQPRSFTALLFNSSHVMTHWLMTWIFFLNCPWMTDTSEVERHRERPISVTVEPVGTHVKAH